MVNSLDVDDKLEGPATAIFPKGPATESSGFCGP